jgi:branched-chain amino acid transport system substrate-binding protein
MNGEETMRGCFVPKLFLGILSAIAGVAAISVVSWAQSAATGKPILLGAHGDRAKQASYYSMLYKDAVDAFVDELNRNGGINGRPVQILFEDDENNPVAAAARVEKLASQGVSYILSLGSSATGVAAQAKGEELKIPVGSPTNTITALSEPLRKYYFRTSIRDEIISASLVEYVKQKVPDRKVAVVRDTTETGLLTSDTMIKLFKEAGIEIVGVEQITPGSSDVTAQALRIKDSGASIVLLAGASIPDLANYVKAHKSVGNKMPMIGNYVFTTASFGRLTGNTSDGFLFVDSVYPERPEVQEIEKKLISTKGDRFRNNLSAVHAWEYIRLVTDAIRRADSDDREAIRNAMEETKDWPIAMGPPGMKLNYSPTNHDLFTAPEQAVIREYRDGQPGPAVPWK